MREIIVNLTTTGMIPTKEMTPYVPIEPKEIIEDVLACAEIGVTMVHLHARDKSGIPTWDPEIYSEMLVGIRKYRPDLILGISLSGRNFQEFEKRSAGLFLTGDAKPDTGSLTTSSLNFNKQASVSSPDMIQKLAQTMLEKEILPELEIFDSGMVNYMKYLIKKELLRPPYYANLLFGNIACAQSTMLEAGVVMNALPKNTFRCFAGVGDSQLAMNIAGIMFGDGVRVGLEDNIWFDQERTKLANNKMLVQRIKNISEAMECSIMKPVDLRKKLNMNTEKGLYGLKTAK